MGNLTSAPPSYDQESVADMAERFFSNNSEQLVEEAKKLFTEIDKSLCITNEVIIIAKISKKKIVNTEDTDCYFN